MFSCHVTLREGMSWGILKINNKYLQNIQQSKIYLTGVVFLLSFCRGPPFSGSTLVFGVVYPMSSEKKCQVWDRSLNHRGLGPNIYPGDIRGMLGVDY